MNMARQRTKKTDKAPSKRIADVSQTGAKKSAKRTGGQSQKPAGEASPLSFRLESLLSIMLFFFFFFPSSLSKLYSLYIPCHLLSFSDLTHRWTC